MSQIAKYVGIAFAVLFVTAVGVYLDCRISGSNVEVCRMIFKQVGDRAIILIPHGGEP